MVWCVWLWKLKIAFSPAHKWYLNHKQLFSCHHLHKSKNEPHFHSIFPIFYISLRWNLYQWFYEILVLLKILIIATNILWVSKITFFQRRISFNHIPKYCSIQQPSREQQFLKNVIVCTWKCYFGLIDSCNWLILFQ